MTAGLLSLGSLRAGKVQVNLNYPTTVIDFPFLNMMSASDRLWENGGSATDIYSLIGSDGYLTSYPSGASDVRTYTAGYLVSGDTWNLSWDGVGTVSIQALDATLSVSSTGTNPKKYTVTSSVYPLGTAFKVAILITSIGSPKVSNIKFYRDSHQSRIDAGEVWSPDFLNFYKVWGRIRYMNWMSGTVCPVVGWNTMPPEDQGTGSSISKTGFYFLPAIYCGRASKSAGTLNNYTAPNTLSGSPSAWTDGMAVWVSSQNLLSHTSISTVSNASPAQVTATAHGLTTGDKVFFRGSGTFATNIGSSGFYTVTVIDANNFTVPIDTTTWGAFSGTLDVFSQMTVATSSLPATAVIGQAGSNLFATFPGADQDLWQLVYSSLSGALIFSVVGTAAAAQSTMPIGLICDLANKLGNDPWFTIPCRADDNCITQIATSIKNNLSTSLTATIELGNEIWNSSGAWAAYAEYQFTLQAAADPTHWDTTTGYAQYAQWEGWRFVGMMSAFNTVFVGQTIRIRGTICTQLGTSINGSLISGTGTPVSGAPPYTFARSFAFAPYINPLASTVANAQYVYGYKVGGSSRTDALAWLDNQMRTANGASDYCIPKLNSIYTSLAATYKSAPYNLAMENYEGGFNIIPSVCSLTASSYSGLSLLQTALSISGAANNGSNAIRLTVSSSTPTTTLVDGQSYWVGGVLGTEEANGYWQMTVIDSTHVDLVGSVFVNAYVASSGDNILSDVENFIYGYKNSDLFAATQKANLDNFAASGGLFPSQFCITGPQAADQPWQVVSPSIYGTQYPAYTMLRTANGR